VNLADSLDPSSVGKSTQHLALGFFDGLHLGHQRVILGGKIPHPPAATAVLTFRDHPLSILHPERHPALITGLPHKIRVLERWGIGLTIALPFDQSRSQQEPPAFLAELAAAFPVLKTVSVGPNWRFGKNRSGDVELLARWCADRKIILDNPDPVLHAGCRISSSRIREAIQKGNLEEASSMLGRPFTLLGRVITGDGRGKEIGFPTANLKTEDECLPPDGVFAGRALLPEKKTYMAAINLGTRPTFNGQDRRIEAHLIGYSGDLTGDEIDLEFHRFIRPEKKFHDAQSLSAQIKSDLTTISGERKPPLS
jgi:riboflavin kinase/FMN adenylyltransferase